METVSSISDPTRPVINMYRCSGIDVDGSVFVQSEEKAWEILKKQLASKVYNRINKLELVVENVKNGVIVNGGVRYES